MKTLKIWFLALCMALPSMAAHAEELGCKVLLCLAGNWKNIGECVPPVKKVMRDMAKGKPFPACTMQSADGSASGGNGMRADMVWANLDNCPKQYIIDIGGGESPQYACSFSGVLRVQTNGTWWSDVWWSSDENTSTNYSDYARRQLPPEHIDPRFDTDYQSWLAVQPPPPSENEQRGNFGS